MTRKRHAMNKRAGHKAKSHNDFVDRSVALMQTVVVRSPPASAEEQAPSTTFGASHEYVFEFMTTYKSSRFSGASIGDPIEVPQICARRAGDVVEPLTHEEVVRLRDTYFVNAERLGAEHITRHDREELSAMGLDVSMLPEPPRDMVEWMLAVADEDN